MKLLHSYKRIILLAIYFFSCFYILKAGYQTMSISTSGNFDNSLAAELQQTLDDQRVQQEIMGLSAAVLLPNEDIWLGTSGISNPSNGDSISTDMLFWMASISKTFASMVVLQLAEEGVLALDDPLHQWLPSFPNIDSTITIRQLLNHTSGVWDWEHDWSMVYSEIFSNPDKYWTQEEIILTFTDEPYFAPGEGYHYSNTGYLLLSMIIEEATKLDFPIAMEKRFIPLNQLTHTYFAWSDTISDDFAHPWEDDVDLFHQYKTAISTFCYGAGSVISTPKDLVWFVKSLFEGELLTPESMKQMLTFVNNNQYGLGVARSTMYGRELYWHNGALPGFRSIVFYSSQDSTSIAVAINDDDANSIDIALALFEVVLAAYHPRLSIDGSILDLGTINSKFDTTFFVYNTGGKADSVLASIRYSGVADSNAFSIFPPSFILAPGDSQALAFFINPELLAPKKYAIRLHIDSKFSPLTPSRIKPIKFKVTSLSIVNTDKDVPAHFSLNQNYPNPFNPTTSISFSIPKREFVTVEVFNMLGQVVMTLESDYLAEGTYTYNWDAGEFPSGVYLYRLTTTHFVQNRKMLLMR